MKKEIQEIIEKEIRTLQSDNEFYQQIIESAKKQITQNDKKIHELQTE